MSEGYILLDRKILKWEWYDDGNTKDVFIHLLLKANWKDKKWHGQTIKRGQLVIGRKNLAKELGMSEQTVRTSLKRLKSTNEITTNPTNKYSLITIINYNTYQIPQQPTNQQINQPTNQQLTNNQPTTNQQLTTTNTIKNIKKEKNTTNTLGQIQFDRFWCAYPKKRKKGDALKAWKILKIGNGVFEKIMTAVEYWCDSEDWRKEEGKYIPYPASWLRAMGWEDELSGKDRQYRDMGDIDIPVYGEKRHD